MLEVSEEDVGVAEFTCHATLDQVRIFKTCQSRQRTSGADIGDLTPIEDLQCLNEKLDFTNAAAAELHVAFESNRSLDLLIDAKLDVSNLIDCCKIEILTVDERLDQSHEL